jgi:hypothetical protein
MICISICPQLLGRHGLSLLLAYDEASIRLIIANLIASPT